MRIRVLTPAALAIALTFGASGAVLAQTGSQQNSSGASTAMPAPSPATNAASPNSTGANGAALGSAPSNGAVNTAPTNTAGAPVPGANSFTESQARSRLQERGFAQVTDLKLDNQGVWRGQAQHDGHPVAVALDYQGNVTSK